MPCQSPDSRQETFAPSTGHQSHSPFSIFAEKVLLDHDLSFRLDRVEDASVKHRVDHREVAHDACRANVDAIQLIEPLRALERTHETIARHAVTRGAG